MLVLGGGEGAVPLERPSFFVQNFLLQSICITYKKKKSPGISAFYRFCRSGDHHFQNFCTCKSFHRHPRPIYWGSWTCFFSTPGCNSLPECQPYASYKSAPETPHLHVPEPAGGAPHLHAWACCGALQFHPRLAPKPPFLNLLMAQTYMYHNLGQGPSPSTSTLILACKFCIQTCFGKIIIPVQYMHEFDHTKTIESVLMHNACACMGGGGGGCLFCPNYRDHMCKTYISQCPAFVDLCSSWDSYLKGLNHDLLRYNSLHL